jgi:hypothetical protein
MGGRCERRDRFALHTKMTPLGLFSDHCFYLKFVYDGYLDNEANEPLSEVQRH